MRYWIMKDSINNRYIWDDKAKQMFKVSAGGKEVQEIQKTPDQISKNVPFAKLVEKTKKKPDIIDNI